MTLLKKRNKRLRELGYKNLPFNTNKRIKIIEVVDVIAKTTEMLTIEEIAIKFNLTISSARTRIKRPNLYKKRYMFKIIYDDYDNV